MSAIELSRSEFFDRPSMHYAEKRPMVFFRNSYSTFGNSGISGMSAPVGMYVISVSATISGLFPDYLCFAPSKNSSFHL